VRDITDRKRAELDAVAQRQELAHLNRVLMLAEQSGVLAHELSQPLAVILSNAQAVRRLLDHSLLDLDELWGPSYAGMNRVIQPMHHAAWRVNIDPARVYVIGHSLSGHAAWNLALHYPTYFAAFNPLAGTANEDWQRVRLMNLRNVLPVAWHDADDKVIKVKDSYAGLGSQTGPTPVVR